MRYLILWGVILFLDVYAFIGLRSLSTNWPSSLRLGGAILYVLTTIACWVFLIWGGREGMPALGNTANTYYRALVFVVYIGKFLMTPFLFVDDLRRGFGYIVQQFSPKTTYNASRSRFLTTSAAILGALPVGLLTYGMVRNAYRYTIRQVRIPIAGLPESLKGLKVVQLSDIHAGSFTFKEPLYEALALIEKAKPDLIFFTGDLVNDRADEIEPYMDVFGSLKAPLGVYSVLGNHDYGDYVQWGDPTAKTQNLNKLKEAHGKMGWNLLMNEHKTLDIKGEKINIIGVENYSGKPQFPKHGDLSKAVADLPQAALNLLLSHDPSHWDDQVRSKTPQIHVTFSGHTHGFQFGVEIPGFIKWSPIQYVYKQWAGLYQEGAQYLYVNRGFGFLGYPGRVGILPEISVLEFV